MTSHWAPRCLRLGSGHPKKAPRRLPVVTADGRNGVWGPSEWKVARSGGHLGASNGYRAPLGRHLGASTWVGSGRSGHLGATAWVGTSFGKAPRRLRGVRPTFPKRLGASEGVPMPLTPWGRSGSRARGRKEIGEPSIFGNAPFRWTNHLQAARGARALKGQHGRKRVCSFGVAVW
jgi:hypothetical protein